MSLPKLSRLTQSVLSTPYGDSIKMISYQYRKSHCGDKTIYDLLISTMEFPVYRNDTMCGSYSQRNILSPCIAILTMCSGWCCRFQSYLPSCVKYMARRPSAIQSQTTRPCISYITGSHNWTFYSTPINNMCDKIMSNFTYYVKLHTDGVNKDVNRLHSKWYLLLSIGLCLV